MRSPIVHYALLSPSSQYVVYAAQLVGNAYALRAFLETFLAVHALVGACLGREVCEVLLGELLLLGAVVGT